MSTLREKLRELQVQKPVIQKIGYVLCAYQATGKEDQITKLVYPKSGKIHDVIIHAGNVGANDGKTILCSLVSKRPNGVLQRVPVELKTGLNRVNNVGFLVESGGLLILKVDDPANGHLVSDVSISTVIVG